MRPIYFFDRNKSGDWENARTRERLWRTKNYVGPTVINQKSGETTLPLILRKDKDGTVIYRRLGGWGRWHACVWWWVHMRASKPTPGLEMLPDPGLHGAILNHDIWNKHIDGGIKMESITFSTHNSRTSPHGSSVFSEKQVPYGRKLKLQTI